MKRILSFLVVAASLMSSAEAALLARYDYTSGMSGVAYDVDAPVLDGRSSNVSVQATASAPNVGSGQTPGGYLQSNPAYTATTGVTGLNAAQFTTANFSGIIGSSAGSSTKITGLSFDAMVFNQSGTNRAAVASNRGGYIVTYRLGTKDNDGNFVADGAGLFTVLSPFGVTGTNVTPEGVISATGENNSTVPRDNMLRMADVSNSNNAWPVGVYKTYTPTFRFPVFLQDGQFAEFRISLLRQGTSIATANDRPFFRVNNLDIFGTAVPEPASMAVFGALGLGLVARRFRKK
jgi:hypothetical protein